MAKAVTKTAAERESFHHGDARRAAIDAALAIVTASGHQALTLRGVAELIGVNHRALYRHFESLEALHFEVAAIGFAELAKRLEENGDVQTGEGAKRLAAAYARFAIDDINLYTLMFSLPLREVFRSEDGVGPPLRRVVKAAAAGLRDGRSSEDAIKTSVMRVWGLAHGLVGLYIAGAYRARSKAEAVNFIAEAASGLGPEG